jgi:preprotein translocase subunit SecG
MRILLIRILMLVNCIVLVGHLLLQHSRGDLNWLRVGDRSPLSKAYMGMEAALAMILALAVFNYFYPNMKNMCTSKLALLMACIFIVEAAVWLLYQ